MAKDWSYAKMAQDAANAGGPDKWIELIKKTAYNAGASDMKNTLVFPLLATGVGVGIVCTISEQKIYRWIVKKKQMQLIIEQESIDAEKYLKKELSATIEEIQINNGGQEK